MRENTEHSKGQIQHPTQGLKKQTPHGEESTTNPTQRGVDALDKTASLWRNSH